MDIFIVFVCIGLGIWGAYLARNRNRNQVAWGIICALFGLLAVLLVALLPAIEEENKVVKKKVIKNKKL